jgi:hypothetical protein
MSTARIRLTKPDFPRQIKADLAQCGAGEDNVMLMVWEAFGTIVQNSILNIGRSGESRYRHIVFNRISHNSGRLLEY